MTLRPFLFLVLAVIALSATLSLTPASAHSTQGPVASGRALTSGPPEPIYDLDDLSTYTYTLHRELTGAAGQRVWGVYKDNWKTEVGLIPATLPANGRFVIDWDGAVENPDSFVQTLSSGNNRWTEWSVGSRAKAQYNDNALVNLNEPRNELMWWWYGITQWLYENEDSLECSTGTRRVNGEQAIRCLLPKLPMEAMIELAYKLGIFGNEDTASVTTMVFDLWLTKNDTIPVKLDVSMTVVDVKNATFSGVFQVDIFEIDSDDVEIVLPR